MCLLACGSELTFASRMWLWTQSDGGVRENQTHNQLSESSEGGTSAPRGVPCGELATGMPMPSPPPCANSEAGWGRSVHERSFILRILVA